MEDQTLLEEFTKYVGLKDKIRFSSFRINGDYNFRIRRHKDKSMVTHVMMQIMFL